MTASINSYMITAGNIKVLRIIRAILLIIKKQNFLQRFQRLQFMTLKIFKIARWLGNSLDSNQQKNSIISQFLAKKNQIGSLNIYRYVMNDPLNHLITKSYLFIFVPIIGLSIKISCWGAGGAPNSNSYTASCP